MIRRFALASMVLLGLIVPSSSAQAGIVDISLNLDTGVVSLRADPGLNLIAVGMRFAGAGGGLLDLVPLMQPQPNVDPLTVNQFSINGDLYVQLNPPAEEGQFVQTGGSVFVIGTLSNPASVAALDCNNCVVFLGGGVVDDVLGDITAQSSYVTAPEPAAFTLIGLGLAAAVAARLRKRPQR